MEIVPSGFPRYPSFRPLCLEDKPLFDRAFREFPPQISEFTFTNLFSWRQAYHFGVSCFGEFLLVRSRKEKEYTFFEPIGKKDKKQAIEQLIRDTGGSFIRVPEETAALFAPEGEVSAHPDPDNADYLYLAEGLINLPGKKYDGKRNLIRRFKSEHTYSYRVFQASDIPECLDFEERWCTIKDCDSVEGLRNERAAIDEMVRHCAEFSLIAGGITLQGAVAAVAIAEPLNQSTLVMHILKADPNIPGLYQTMLNEFLLKNAAAFTYINLEQDLGVEGLRKAKQSYHPVRMVNKFTLRAPRT